MPKKIRGEASPALRAKLDISFKAHERQWNARNKIGILENLEAELNLAKSLKFSAQYQNPFDPIGFELASVKEVETLRQLQAYKATLAKILKGHLP